MLQTKVIFVIEKIITLKILFDREKTRNGHSFLLIGSLSSTALSLCPEWEKQSPVSEAQWNPSHWIMSCNQRQFNPYPNTHFAWTKISQAWVVLNNQSISFTASKFSVYIFRIRLYRSKLPCHKGAGTDDDTSHKVVVHGLTHA